MDPQASQWTTVFHEKLRYNNSLGDALTMEKLGVCPMESGKRNILFGVCFACYLAQRGSQGPPRVPNGSKVTT